MVSLAQVQAILESDQRFSTQYRCRINLNLYDSPVVERLATQATMGRHLQIEAVSDQSELGQKDCGLTAIAVRLCEDHYPGWLALADLEWLDVAEVGYLAVSLTEAEIRARIPAAIAFAESAMTLPNEYLWGGTVGPNYDCSGLVQTAFAAVGIWLPRDAYQQEAFVQPIPLEQVLPGDLIFFGTPMKATHVGLYLGGDRYIHSSGKDQGRNGIGIDTLLRGEDPVSRTYRAQLRGAGRVIESYREAERG